MITCQKCGIEMQCDCGGNFALEGDAMLCNLCGTVKPGIHCGRPVKQEDEETEETEE